MVIFFVFKGNIGVKNAIFHEIEPVKMAIFVLDTVAMATDTPKHELRWFSQLDT